MAQVVVVTPDGFDPVTVEEPIKLATMYELIGCSYVQAIDTPINEVEMVMDEEGKLNSENRVNRFATALVGDWLAPGDVVVGTVVLCTNRGAEWVGLNDPQLQTVHDELKEARRG